jgi:uncharacterized protein (TIGR02271 family)
MGTMGIQEGMTVRSTDGEKLGKIIACEADRFLVEKGFFFPKDYLVRMEDVAEIRADEVLLRLSGAQLREASAGIADLGEGELTKRGSGWTEPESGIAGGTMSAGTTERMDVPVVEEELSAEKRVAHAGEVRIHKDVVTERREISVPVTKEEVRVERIPAGTEAQPGEATFREETISVPIREEEVEIRKRPVVREQVRVSKTSRQEERRASEDVRREEVDVEKEGDVHVTGVERGEPKE